MLTVFLLYFTQSMSSLACDLGRIASPAGGFGRFQEPDILGSLSSGCPGVQERARAGALGAERLASVPQAPVPSQH